MKESHDTIWKFPLLINDLVELQMPKGAVVLHVALQGKQPCLWALVNSTEPTEIRKFRIVGTGHLISLNEVPLLTYIGSFLMHGGALVFHVFERELAEL